MALDLPPRDPADPIDLDKTRPCGVTCWGGRLLALMLVPLMIGMLLPPEWHGMGRIEPHALQQILSTDPDRVLVLDVRTGMEYRRGHIDGALSVPLHQLPFALSKVRPYKRRELVIICMSGHRSRVAGLMLQAAGFGARTNLSGGMAAWQANGLAVVTAPAA